MVSPASAKTGTLNLKWSELGAAVANRQASVFLANTVRLQITEVRPESLVMTIVKTSDKQAYSAEPASICWTARVASKPGLTAGCP